MRTFCTIILPIGLAIGMLGLIGFWAWPNRAKVLAQAGATNEQFDRVQIGMSEQQVEAILGQPTKKTGGYGTLKNGTHAPIVLPFYYAGVGGAVIRIEYYNHQVTDKRWISPESKGGQYTD